MYRRIADTQDRPGELWKTGVRNPVVFLFVGAAGSGSCIFLNLLIARITFFTEACKQAAIRLSGRPLYFMLATAGILIPVAEELVFRGFGYLCLRRRFSFIPAALISSVCFSIYHGNMAQGLYAFVLGILMAWICEQCHSLGMSAWFHISANISAVLFTGLPAEVQQRFTAWPMLPISLGLVFLGIYKIKRGCKIS